MADSNAPYYPIIFLRGYAGDTHGQDEAAADPFTGFNEGSTVYRATTEKDKPKKFVFESSLVRLMKDYGYGDVYRDGADIVDAGYSGKISPKSVVIYRYYDVGSKLLGTGKTPTIGDSATGLGPLILRIRDLVCSDPDNEMKPEDFRCYLLAHSMGGLVVRAFLQNPAYSNDEARACVDKVFTYATPHNGIDMAGLNVPEWLSFWDANNFSREYMARYLAINEPLLKNPGDAGRVDWLPEERFPSRRFFCMVGTNRGDYEVAMGLSRTFAGNGSDGLVRIANASVWGVDANGHISTPTATAYAYRSHSGYFGIVNSEEAYQNLVRFLFGTVRIDIWLEIDSVQLPKLPDGTDPEQVEALYQFELLASPRGRPWYLSRRIAEEDSVACRTHKELTDPASSEKRKVFLSSVFLGKPPRRRRGAGSGGRLLRDPGCARARLRGPPRAVVPHARRGRVPVPRHAHDRDHTSRPVRGRGARPAGLGCPLRLAERQHGRCEPAARPQPGPRRRRAIDGSALRQR